LVEFLSTNFFPRKQNTQIINKSIFFPKKKTEKKSTYKNLK
jgi:hypothetical protein